MSETGDMVSSKLEDLEVNLNNLYQMVAAKNNDFFQGGLSQFKVGYIKLDSARNMRALYERFKRLY